MTARRSIFYVGLGRRALKLAVDSATELRKYTDIPINIITNVREHRIDGMVSVLLHYHIIHEVDPNRYGRWKTEIGDIAANMMYDQVLYLDADTFPRGNLDAYFAPLDAGWEWVMCPSRQQGADVFWHVSDREREITEHDLQHRPMQLQAGAFAFRFCEPVWDLLYDWQAELNTFQTRFDQAAFHRALRYNPVRMWLLGSPFNGGAVLDHRHGTISAEQP